MIFVLDSNVALIWVLAEPDWSKAKNLRADFQKTTHELLAPDVFNVEVAHALAQGGTSREDNNRTGGNPLGRCPLPLHRNWKGRVLSCPRAIAISSAMGVGVYDCLYVALAEREHCELITADNKLTKKLQGQFYFIKPLASLP